MRIILNKILIRGFKSGPKIMFKHQSPRSFYLVLKLTSFFVFCSSFDALSYKHHWRLNNSSPDISPNGIAPIIANLGKMLMHALRCSVNFQVNNIFAPASKN